MTVQPRGLRGEEYE